MGSQIDYEGDLWHQSKQQQLEQQQQQQFPLSENRCQKKSKNKTNALIYEKSRLVDYSSLKPLKSSNMQNFQSVKNLQQQNSFQRLDSLKLEDLDRSSAKKSRDEKLNNQRHQATSRNKASVIQLSGNKSNQNSTKKLRTPPFHGKNSASYHDLQNIKKEQQQFNIQKRSSCNINSPNYSNNHEWKNKYIRMQKRLKTQLRTAEKKDVQLRTQLLTLQQKVLLLQERNTSKINSQSQNKRVQAIKQATVKSLQPEINKIIQMHDIELARLKSQQSDNLQFAKIEYETMLQSETKRLQNDYEQKIKDQLNEQMKQAKLEYDNRITNLSNSLNQANDRIEQLVAERIKGNLDDKSTAIVSSSVRQESSKDNKFAQIIERMKNDHDQELKLMKQKITAEKEEEFLQISKAEIKKIKLEAEQKLKLQAIELQNKHQRDIDELIVKLSKGGKSDALKMKSAASNLKNKQLNLKIEQNEKIISDLAFKLDTEQTASAIIARRLASAESLSSQKDDIIRSLNMQLLDISLYQKSNLEQDEKQLKANNSTEDQMMKLKNQTREVEIQHSEYIKEMEKKHKQQLDSLGCKLACLQAHYARITGDVKAAGMSQESIDKTSLIQ